MKKFLISLGAMSLAIGQTTAAAALPAAERVGAPVASAEEMGGDFGETWLFAVLLGAIIAGVLIATNDDDMTDFIANDPPYSP